MDGSCGTNRERGEAGHSAHRAGTGPPKAKRRRSQEQSAIGQIAEAIEGALRNLVQDVSEDGIEL